MNEDQVTVVTVFWLMANCLLTAAVLNYVYKELHRLMGLCFCFIQFFLLFFWAAGTGTLL